METADDPSSPSALSPVIVFAMPPFFTVPLPWKRCKRKPAPSIDDAASRLAVATATARVNRQLDKLNAAVQVSECRVSAGVHACVDAAAGDSGCVCVPTYSSKYGCYCFGVGGCVFHAYRWSCKHPRGANSFTN